MRTDDGCRVDKSSISLGHIILVAVFMFGPDGQRRDLLKQDLGKMGLRDKIDRSCTFS